MAISLVESTWYQKILKEYLKMFNSLLESARYQKIFLKILQNGYQFSR